MIYRRKGKFRNDREGVTYNNMIIVVRREVSLNPSCFCWSIKNARISFLIGTPVSSIFLRLESFSSSI